AVRARRFASDETLWTWETKRNNDCAEGHLYLARSAYLAGRLNEAAFHAMYLQPPDSTLVAFANREVISYYNGLIALSRGKIHLARAFFLELLENGLTANFRGEAAYELALIAFIENDYSGMVHLLNQALTFPSAEVSRSDMFLLRSYANLQLGHMHE